jgi:hypothetical protein
MVDTYDLSHDPRFAHMGHIVHPGEWKPGSFYGGTGNFVNGACVAHGQLLAPERRTQNAAHRKNPILFDVLFCIDFDLLLFSVFRVLCSIS